jgi:hypothetical protein
MLTALGFIAMAGVLIGFVWILFSAFGDSIGWGVAILFISPLAFIYGILRWDELKVPMVLLCAGVAAQIAKRAMLH